MTAHDLLEWGEYVLRNDKEYCEEIDRLKGEIDKLVYRQRAIMAAAIVRLAVSMIAERHSDSKCVAGLWIKTPHEDIRLQADDVVITLLPRIFEHMETGLQNEY